MIILKCSCGYSWTATREYVDKYGEAGKVCPCCGEIGIEQDPEAVEFYDI